MLDRMTGRPQRSLRSTLRAGTIDGAAFSGMVGIGEAYLPAFVLALGLGEVRAGLTATVPMLLGAVLQLSTPHLVRRLGTHRRCVITCAAVQAAAFAPLFVAALVGRISWFVVVLITACYWGAGLGAGPAWNTWMARLVPPQVRAPYFAKRSTIAQVAVLLGLVTGGSVLHWSAGQHIPLHGFAVLFAAAFTLRMISTGFLVRQHEPAATGASETRVPLPALIRRLRQREGRLLAYMLTVQATTHFAAPFFTPYMLSELALPYATYVTLLGAAFVAKVLALAMLTRFAARIGARRLLWIGGIGVAPLSALWCLWTAPSYLFVIQLVSGVAWACYELATFLLVFEMIADSERTSVLTSFNLVNALALTAGSLAGGALLRSSGGDRAAYLLVFLISAAGRTGTLLLLRRVAGISPIVIPAWLRFRTVAVRPAAGTIDRPILPTLDEHLGEESLVPQPVGRSKQL